jgi:hypothetical protein
MGKGGGGVFFSPPTFWPGGQRGKKKGREKEKERERERERESTQHDIPNSSWMLWGLLLLVQLEN